LEKKNDISQLDLFVKTKVIEDAILLAMKSPDEQVKLIGKGRYFNSYKMIGDGTTNFDNIDIVRFISNN
jgi:tubulin polyglutamylase TTLL11